jgi:HrpA-like RNA helicase
LLADLDVESVAGDMEHAAAASLRAWWAAMAQVNLRTVGKKLGLPSFVADFLCWLHEHESGGGAILCFCCGAPHIKAVQQGLEDLQKQGRMRGAMLMSVYGQQGSAFQQGVFRRPPRGQRKVILATNIAETSITIDDVTIVVDIGFHKVTSYDAKTHLKELLPTWCVPADA